MKKTLIVALLAIFVFFNVFGLLLFVRPAHAQLPVFVTGSAPETVKEVKQTISSLFLSTALGALLNAGSYFLRKMAYDAAIFVASGDWGQSSNVFGNNAGEYFKQIALDSAATAIESIGSDFGINLCQTPNIDFQLYLKIGLGNLYALDSQGPQPSCSWQQMTDAWSEESLSKEFGEYTDVGKMFNNSIRVEQSDFGIAAGAMSQVGEIKGKAEAGAQGDRLEGQGFKSITELISGKVKTPAQTVREETMAVTQKSQGELTAIQTAGIYGSGAKSAVLSAVSVFLNTLVSQSLRNLQGLLTGDDEGSGSETAISALSYEASGFKSSRKRMQEVFSDFLTISVEKRSDFDLMLELHACPEPPARAGINNCVIDDGLRDALSRALTGEPMTIEDALKEGKLNGTWPLISPKRLADNLDRNCRINKYCASNITKLRKYRILPVGFELATMMADIDNPEDDWTLEDVVEGFDDCGVNDVGIKNPDPEKYPYCHLIDPKWIIKLPESRCNAWVYGENLVDDESGTRAQECADVVSCLHEKETQSGSRLCESYGYCSKEKNVWRFGADMCDEQYNTCTTYIDSNGKPASYLARTVDFGECSLETKGCTAYSTEKQDGEWIASINAKVDDYKLIGRNQAFYFNSQIDSFDCTEENSGCSAFYLSDTTVEGKYKNTYNTERLLYIKKAPEYLGCYDYLPNTPEIDWPQTKQQLALIKSNEEECSNFAQVCLPDEVGCDLYTPENDPDALDVPGIIGNNVCKSMCEGYDTFKQIDTNFAPSEFPLYFIPKEATECPGEFTGCDEFTNVDEVVKGGEGLEYYTDLKYCEKPDVNNQKVFYSWEGSTQEGYILKTHSLRPVKGEDLAYLKLLDPDFGAEQLEQVFSVGSPAYVETKDFKGFLETNYELCNEEGYNKLINGGEPLVDGASGVDCRALYDKTGKIYYRILEDTITIDEACHPLRKTTSFFEQDPYLTESAKCIEKGGRWFDDKCERCTNGGIYDSDKKVCMYWTISKPGESESCQGPINDPGKWNGCRKYKGNKGNKVTPLAFIDFEPTGEDDNALVIAKDGWEPKEKVKIAAESLQVNLHSLLVDNNEVSYSFSATDYHDDIKLEKNGWYELSFWTRGTAQKLEVYFEQDSQVVGSFTFDPSLDENYKLTVSEDWKEFKLGPAQFTGDQFKEINLVFKRSSISLLQPAKMYFIDNLRLGQITETFPLIKDSWKKAYNLADGLKDKIDVPLECDSEYKDPYPGKALGCQAYIQESDGKTVYTTGFDSLCREQAKGCQPVFDTYNTYNSTNEKDAQYFNLWCQGNDDNKCQLIIDESVHKCTVPQGEEGCFLEQVVIPEGFNLPNHIDVVASTVVIPADGDDDKPAYLTVSKESVCDQSKIGCQEVGKELKVMPIDEGYAYEHEDKYRKLNPEHYLETLCREDLVGCNEYRSGNNVFYFKDPVQTGQSFCEYQDNVEKDGAVFVGWFKKDIGYCYDAVDKKIDPEKFCRNNKDCGEGNSCKDIGEVPCYTDYLQAGGKYGIWSNTTPNYNDMVGNCPVTANGCHEFVDPADTSDLHPKGQPYYVIYNSKLDAKVDACDGGVSQKEGCILFRQTDKPNLWYDSSATYKKSKENKYKLVSPESTKNNDSNIFLKVVRDRECSEWLACQASLEVEDDSLEVGKRQVCGGLQLCAEGTNEMCEKPATSKFINQVLDLSSYIKRDTSWSGGEEYTGYSIPGHYSVAALDFVSVGEDKDISIFVAKKDYGLCTGLGDGVVCGSGSNGVCYKDNCIYPFSGAFEKTVTVNNFQGYLIPKGCRGYPEQSSPFSDQVVIKWESESIKINNQWTTFYTHPQEKRKGFDLAGVCQKDEDCDCDYKEVEYGSLGGEKRFYSVSNDNLNLDLLSKGICQAGDYPGIPCNDDEDCGVDDNKIATGSCEEMYSQRSRVGWKGYCLEKDNGRVLYTLDNGQPVYPCLTWLPIDYLKSEFDVYYNDVNAGYVFPAPGNAGKSYCTEMLGLSSLLPLEQKGGKKEGLRYYCDWTDQDVAAPLKNQNYCGDTLFWDDDNMEEDLKQTFDYQRMANLVWGLFINTDSGLGDGHPFSFVEKNMDPVNNGKGSFDPWPVVSVYPGPNFLSRVDLAASVETPSDRAGDDKDDSGDWQTTEINDNIIHIAPWIISFMATQGYEGKTYAPLLSDPEKPQWITTYGQVDSFFWNVPFANGKTFKLQTTPTNDYEEGNKHHNDGWDTGIVRHQPNRLETFLNKKMIKAVSFIPMWPSEIGNDEAHIDALPKLGSPLTISFNLNKNDDYQSLKDGDSEDVTPGYSSQATGQGTGAYWILKTKHEVNSEKEDQDPFYPNEELEGYLLQWFVVDPINSSQNKSEQTNTGVQGYKDNNYLVNPLLVKGGNADIPCKYNEATYQPDGDGWNGNHFFAIEVLFNTKTGKFVGYRSRNCTMMGGTDSEWGYAMAVVFSLQPMCVEGIDTFDVKANIGESNNKAWANRLWEDSGYGEVEMVTNENWFSEYNKALLKDSSAEPFGSIYRNGANKFDWVKSAAEDWYYPHADVYDNVAGDGDPHAGYPFVCRSEFQSQEPGSNSDLWFKGACVNDTDGLYDSSSIDFIKPKFNIREIFAKVYSVFARVSHKLGLSPDVDETVLMNEWKSDEKYVVSNQNVKVDQIYSSTFGDYADEDGAPPHIYPVKCSSLGGKKALVESTQDGFSINCSDGNKVNSSLFGIGNKFITLEFYAWAAHNQMPIKQIIFDWDNQGTGSIQLGNPGYYKNSKPYCEADKHECVKLASNPAFPGINIDNCITTYLDDRLVKGGNNSSCYYPALNSLTGLTCEIDDECPADYKCMDVESKFGNREESCLTDPYKGKFNYNCNITDDDKDWYYQQGNVPNKPYVYSVKDIKDKLNRIDWHDYLANDLNYNEEDLVCVYKPKVQILDNWGWCTGSCYKTQGDTVWASQPVLGTGCYSETEEGGKVKNHCDVEDDKSVAVNRHWVEFKGIVVVAPLSEKETE